MVFSFFKKSFNHKVTFAAKNVADFFKFILLYKKRQQKKAPLRCLFSVLLLV